MMVCVCCLVMIMGREKDDEDDSVHFLLLFGCLVMIMGREKGDEDENMASNCIGLH